MNLIVGACFDVGYLDTLASLKGTIIRTYIGPKVVIWQPFKAQAYTRNLDAQWLQVLMQYILRPKSKDLGTTLGARYIPYSYMEPLGWTL